MDENAEHQNPFASPLAEEAPAATTGDIAEAEAIRRDHLSREATIKSLGTVSFLGGILLTMAAVAGLVATVSDGFGSAEAAGALTGTLIPAAVAGLTWWVAFGLRRLSPKVRPWAIILSGLWLLVGVLSINPIAIIISISALWALIGARAKFIFTPAYREVMAATPHMKYKTSMVVWVLLGAVLLLIVLALVGAGLRWDA